MKNILSCLECDLVSRNSKRYHQTQHVETIAFLRTQYGHATMPILLVQNLICTEYILRSATSNILITESHILVQLLCPLCPQCDTETINAVETYKIKLRVLLWNPSLLTFSTIV